MSGVREAVLTLVAITSPRPRNVDLNCAWQASIDSKVLNWAYLDGGSVPPFSAFWTDGDP